MYVIVIVVKQYNNSNSNNTSNTNKIIIINNNNNNLNNIYHIHILLAHYRNISNTNILIRKKIYIHWPDKSYAC